MLPIQYTYLFGTSLFFLPWTFIFITRKDLRELLIRVGILFAILGLIGEYFWWTKDWWKPYTVTGTIIGIEDVLFGFSTAGVAASLYLVLFKKRLKKNPRAPNRTFLLGLIVISTLTLFAMLFYLGANSMISTFFTMLVASALILIRQKQLVIPAVISGLLMMSLTFFIYLAMIYVTPSFIEQTWMLENLSGVFILQIPVEEFVFYFLSGVLCFTVYPYYRDAQLQNL